MAASLGIGLIMSPAGAAPTIAVGTLSNAVAVNSVTNTIYVANAGDDTVSVVNGSTNTVVATVTVGDTPLGVAVNPATNTVGDLLGVN